MASLQKEQVIEKFTLAYSKANGKAPSIEAKGGWYSVDGGKNVRLAQLEEMANEFGIPATPAAAESKPKSTPKPKAKKAAKSKAGKGDFSVKSFWNEQIKSQNSGSILPR